MTVVLALDPGKVTGWSLWKTTTRIDLPAIRWDYGLIRNGVEGFVSWFEKDRPVPITRIVCERFKLDQRTASPDLTPVLIEGALVALRTVPITWSQTSTKAQVSDDLLINKGLWLTGSDEKIQHTDARDVNDSQIHALAWFKQNHRGTAEWMYPMPKR